MIYSTMKKKMDLKRPFSVTEKLLRTKKLLELKTL